MWEYEIESVNMSDRWSVKAQQKELETFHKRRNTLGRNGWDMISYEAIPVTGAFTARIKGYAYLCFFKKPITPPAPSPPDRATGTLCEDRDDPPAPQPELDPLRLRG